MKVTLELRDVLIILATLLVLSTVLSVSDFGARMHAVSDSIGWQILPWVLLLLFGWYGTIKFLKYVRGDPKR